MELVLSPVKLEVLTRVARELGTFLAVSNAFRDGAVIHAHVVTELDEQGLRRAWEPYRGGRRDADPMLAALPTAAPERVTARRRHEVVPDRAWYGSRLVHETFRPLGMDHNLQSEVRLGDGTVHRLAFARAWGDRPHAPDELDRVRCLHEALVSGWRARAALHLSPRARTVLARLCDGDGAKQIGDALGLSRATVARAIAEIYRAHGVRSRAELLAVRAHAGAAAGAARERLSPRERETLDLLLTGISERAIACVLGVSYYTLHDYTKRVYRALGARSRSELAATLRAERA